MNKIICPFCKSTESTKMSEWFYGKIKSSQLKCNSCNKRYKFYQSKANSTWTIPKPKSDLHTKKGIKN